MEKESRRYALGVDVGGTFTDLILACLSDGEISYHKVPSTPEDPSEAVEIGAVELLRAAGAPSSAVVYFGHGTTVATNAVLEGRTASTGLITTSGFRDVLEIRRQRQPHNYDIRMPKPIAPVPRHLRREVRERIHPRNFRPDQPPKKEDLEAILSDFEREGVEAVAVCFLHGYHNTSHEEMVADWVRRRLPGVFVCASHEVLAEFREFERMSTTVINASLGRVMSRYLNRLIERAEALGLGAKPHILQSSGGVTSAREAARRPVRTLASGPAAGVMGAVHVSRQAGFPDVITFDVGGTSTEVSLVEGGRPLVAQEREFAGHPVRFPMLDVHSVGAGGGSVAWVDAGSFLHVGPRSAGASPGPACYGRGGTEPTVTDANVVLGRLHPDRLLGGRMSTRPDLARKALEENVGRPMGLSVEEAAVGILTVLNANLGKAIRVISVERGFDPRRFVLTAFGGAGPLLASQLAKELGIDTILVPEAPGLLCAHGLLTADVRCDFSLTRIMGIGEDGVRRINEVFEGLEREALGWLETERIPKDQRLSLLRAIDMRFIGQGHELTVGIQEEPLRSERDLMRVVEAFRAEHEKMYGYAPEAPMQAVTFRLSAVAGLFPPVPGNGSDSKAALVERPSPSGSRRVFFGGEGEFVDTPVFQRGQLSSGWTAAGPVIVEQMDTTTVVSPGQRVSRDERGNLLIRTEGSGSPRA